jgi:hypothetical protein
MNTYLNELLGYTRAAGAEKENSVPVPIEGYGPPLRSKPIEPNASRLPNWKKLWASPGRNCAV